MSVSRRGFFKLVAAGAAVSFLPIEPIAEAAALVAPANRPISQGLWRVLEVSYTVSSEELVCDMELVRKDVTVRFSMRVDKMHSIRPGDMIEMELDYQLGIQLSLDGTDLDSVQSVTVEQTPWIDRLEYFDADSAFDRMDMSLSPVRWGNS